MIYRCISDTPFYHVARSTFLSARLVLMCIVTSCLLIVDDIDDWTVECGVTYDGPGARIFDRTVEISSSVNWTTLLRYSSTPPYFPSSSERKASMVSGLYASIQQTIPSDGTGMQNYRQENILRAASLLDAKRGSSRRRAMIFSLAGSRPTLVRA